MKAWKSCQQETQIGWVSMKACESCQQETHIGWVSMKACESCQEETACLGFNEGMEIMSTGKQMFGCQ